MNEFKPLTVVEHSWYDSGIYAGERRIALLSIEAEATEETQQELEADMVRWARLFAAAPDLLAALREVIGWVPAQEVWHTDAPMKAVERARAAIARATGDAHE